MRRTSIEHEFVEYVPSELVEGVLYVSIRYATAVHRCACGCGNKVVTPITPADWHLVFDGDTASLTPSIGSWGFPCRSHYWIKRDEIRWSGDWTDEQVVAGRQGDNRSREAYFTQGEGVEAGVAAPVSRPVRHQLNRLRKWLRL